MEAKNISAQIYYEDKIKKLKYDIKDLEDFVKYSERQIKYELDRVKARAKSGLVMQQESTAARAGAMARQWFHLGRIRTLAEDLERLDNLTVESIENWLAKNPLTEITTVSLGRDPLEVPDAVSP